MLHALSTPVLKSFAIGGILLGLGVAARLTAPETHRLVLHAPAERGAVYLSAFDDDGEVEVEGALPRGPFMFEIQARGGDGCRWLAVETLEPIDGRTYAYGYAEYIVSCEPGATPYRKTPRRGIVTVDD